MDNVRAETSVEELSRFVSSLKVKVVSCFEVKNRLSVRQRRTDDDARSDDHMTFRLCIANTDSSKLSQSNALEQNVINRPGNVSAEIIGRSSKTSTTVIAVEQYLSVAKANSKGNAQSDDDLNSAAVDLTSAVNRFLTTAMINVDDPIGVASVCRRGGPRQRNS